MPRAKLGEGWRNLEKADKGHHGYCCHVLWLGMVFPSRMSCPLALPARPPASSPSVSNSFDPEPCIWKSFNQT